MRDLLDFVLTPLTLVVVGVLVLALLPGLVLRILVRLYPPDDPRRTELMAELHAVPPDHRPTWVAQQIETALLDGLPARARQLRRKRPAQTRPAQTRSARRRPAPTRHRTRALPLRRTPEVTAITAGMAVAAAYFVSTALFWSFGPLLFAIVPLALFPFFPLYLLAAVALHRRRRLRRARGRSSR